MISVIIPVYNGAKYLEKCLRSVMAQSYRDLEIIVIDDGSKDNSAEICAKLAEEDPRIRLIRQENAGVSAARNRALKEAAGAYITFVDCDDYLDADMYERMFGCITKHNAPDLISTGVYYETESGNVFLKQEANGHGEETELDTSAAFKHIFAGLLGAPIWNKCFKADIIREFDLAFRRDIFYSEDLLFLCEFVSHSNGAIHIHQDFYHYIKNRASATNKAFSEKYLSFLCAYDEIERIANEKFPDALTEVCSGKAGQLCSLIFLLYYSDYAEKAELIHKYKVWLRKHLYVIKAEIPFRNRMIILLIAASPKLGCGIWKIYKGYRRRKYNQ